MLCPWTLGWPGASLPKGHLFLFSSPPDVHGLETFTLPVLSLPIHPFLLPSLVSYWLQASGVKRSWGLGQMGTPKVRGGWWLAAETL